MRRASTPDRCWPPRSSATRRPFGPARTTAGLAPDLLWLVAELAVSPFALRPAADLFFDHGRPTIRPARGARRWAHGYCPLCGSWPALAEVAAGHRVLRCSFCALAWDAASRTRASTAAKQARRSSPRAPDPARTDRRLEVCGTCGGYLKTIDVPELSPFPLLAIADLETMDLDMAAMERGYQPAGAARTSPGRSERPSSASRIRKPCVTADHLQVLPDSCSMSLCRLLPCASIVTMAGKSSTVRCHIASGVPNSSSDTSSTLLDGARVELRRAADGVQVDRAVFLERRQRLRAHAALADHRADAVPLDDLALIRLLANAGRRTGGRDAPAVAFLHDDRAAVIEHRAAQIDRRLVLHQV